MADMISPERARELIMQTVSRMARTTLPLEEALGYFLAEDVAAPFEMPLFDNSAMDGYAVRSGDIAAAAASLPVPLQVVSVVAAGDNPLNRAPLAPGQAVQIFTGAMVPSGADTVIRQEDVVVDADGVWCKAAAATGANIRRTGEELQSGDILLQAGDRISPAAISLLAMFGIQQVQVYRKPRVGCIVTGSELVEAGAQLKPGQIYDSNSAMLAAALADAGHQIAFMARSTDDREELQRTMAEALRDCDVLLISGGVSVGAFDYVKEAAAAVGLETIFWKVAQKPGKPIYFAADRENHKYLFGLPGNPASALTCFYEYVRLAFFTMMGSRATSIQSMEATLSNAFTKKPGLTHFLKARFAAGGEVEILEGQGSHMMSSYAKANCLAVSPPDTTELKQGDRVLVHLVTL
jgi:molybdopterin molybdotransferase